MQRFFVSASQIFRVIFFLPIFLLVQSCAIENNKHIYDENAVFGSCLKGMSQKASIFELIASADELHGHLLTTKGYIRLDSNDYWFILLYPSLDILHHHDNASSLRVRVEDSIAREMLDEYGANSIHYVTIQGTYNAPGRQQTHILLPDGSTKELKKYEVYADPTPLNSLDAVTCVKVLP